MWLEVQPLHHAHPELRVHPTAGGPVLCDGFRYQFLTNDLGYPVLFDTAELKRYRYTP
jgi:hypothetical protein